MHSYVLMIVSDADLWQISMIFSPVALVISDNSVDTAVISVVYILKKNLLEDYTFSS